MRNPSSIDGSDDPDVDPDVDHDGGHAKGPCLKSLIHRGVSYQDKTPTSITKHQTEYLVRYVDSDAGKVD